MVPNHQIKNGAVNLCKLLLNPPNRYICSDRPRKCDINANFIIPTKNLADVNDVKADQLGTFNNKGNHIDHVRVRNGQMIKLPNRPQIFTDDILEIKKTYFTSKFNKDFKRRITEICDNEGKLKPYILLQYTFSNEEHELITGPHGNATKNLHAFKRVQPSTVTEMKKQIASGKAPSEITEKLYEKQGGIRNMTNITAVPRNVRQIYNLSNDNKEKEAKDELFAVIEQCKEDQKQANKFIRRIEAAPELQILTGYDHQFKDVVRFCCDPANFSIFGVDTTFGCGDFYVTPTTYKHLLLNHTDTNRHPTMIGPTMVSFKKDRSAYSFLGASLVREESDIKHVVALGRDGDDRIGEGMQPHLPLATNVLCKLHIEKNCTSHMSEFGISKRAMNEIKADIFGNDKTRERGLADCLSSAEFDAKLMSLQAKWEQLETASTNTTKPRFFNWFKENKAIIIKEYMLYPLRRELGLGYDFFYNNPNESINNSIKKQNNYKKAHIPMFINNVLAKAITIQTNNIERAIIGKGPYRLAKQYQHLAYEEDAFMKLKPQERDRHIKLLFNLKPKPEQPVNNDVRIRAPRHEEQAPRREEQAPRREEQASGLAEQASGPAEQATLSVPFDDAKLPEITFKGMWQKAAILLKEDGNIVDAPGSHGGKNVSSSSGDIPHYVCSRINGSYICDCLGYKEKGMCAHTLAVADSEGKLQMFLNWFKRGGKSVSITKLISRTKPNNSGEKPGKNKRKKKDNREPVNRNTDQYVSRLPPGLKPPFRLKWLADTTAYVCYGCKNHLREKDKDGNKSKTVPSPPYDAVICGNEKRSFIKDGELKVSIRNEDTHYHLYLDCVRSKHPNFTGKNTQVVPNQNCLD